MEAKDKPLLTKLDWQEEEKKITFSVSFKKTGGVKTDIVIIKGEIFSNDYSLRDVYTEAKKCSLGEMEAENACLIAEKITAEDMDTMGLRYIIVMHKPITSGNIFMDEDCLFEIIHSYECCRLELLNDRPMFSKYTSSYGFAFAINS